MGITDVKAWYLGKKGGLKGRPRLYFGQPLDAFQQLRCNAPHDRPEWAKHTHTGYAWDGEEAWQAKLLLAYAPGYYWLGLTGAHSLPGRIHWFPSPLAQKDVLPVLDRYQPKLQWRWYASYGQVTFAPSWTHLMRFSRGQGAGTFFVCDAAQKKVMVGAGAQPLSRIGAASSLIGNSLEKPQLIGVCAEPEPSTARLQVGTSTDTHWVAASKANLKLIAKWSSNFAREVLLEREGDYAAERRITSTLTREKF